MGWEEEEKNKEEAMGYGTFAASQPYPQPYGAGFPQPVPPPGIGGINPFAAAGVYPPAPAGVPPTGAASSAIYPPVHSLHPTAFPYYTQGYQTNPIAQGVPLRMHRLPCCRLGVGWILFILGFFLAAIPWYVGAFVLLFVRVDYREKPGFVACTIAVSAAFRFSLTT
ncbi:60S ribosomal protein L18a-1 [Apostasia shenzhenica]|uniref:60S ribosomal protein L18a-1 n=1 Tax=Apostasia shenzhenica TaxID=1088818 RepID=A0A2I0A276_9ASPA|nr:60S ribosomal protein L18a-1 [Apostasia shenzhenica]